MESFHANRRVRSLLNLLSCYFSHSYYGICVCVYVSVPARARLFHCVARPQTIDTSPGVHFENILLHNTPMSCEGTIAKSIVTSWNYLMKFLLSIDLLVALTKIKWRDIHILSMNLKWFYA